MYPFNHQPATDTGPMKIISITTLFLGLVAVIQPPQHQVEPTTTTEYQNQQLEEIEPVTVDVSRETIKPLPGTCESEIVKYDWPHSTAIAVMEQESSRDPRIVNDNPNTGDYSIGCFQVNIIGDLKYSRPPEAQLKKPSVNVRWAYNKYVAEGRTFCTTGGWYNTCRKIGLIP